MTEQPADRLRTHPRERLASPVQQVSLAAEAAKLRNEPHPPVKGHRQVAVVRHGPITVILFVFDADGFIKEHSAAGEVTIHVLSGQLIVSLRDGEVQLGTGELVSLAPGVPHAVRATETTDMLLTVSQSSDH